MSNKKARDWKRRYDQMVEEVKTAKNIMAKAEEITAENEKLVKQRNSANGRVASMTAKLNRAEERIQHLETILAETREAKAQVTREKGLVERANANLANQISAQDAVVEAARASAAEAEKVLADMQAMQTEVEAANKRVRVAGRLLDTFTQDSRKIGQLLHKLRGRAGKDHQRMANEAFDRMSRAFARINKEIASYRQGVSAAIMAEIEATSDWSEGRVRSLEAEQAAALAKSAPVEALAPAHA